VGGAKGRVVGGTERARLPPNTTKPSAHPHTHTHTHIYIYTHIHITSHYYHRAAAIAAELRAEQEARRAAYRLQHHALIEGGERMIYHPNQFENLANFRAHFETTGPEIYRQARGRVDAFVAAAGTGGTLAGVGVYLKQKQPNVRVRGDGGMDLVMNVMASFPVHAHSVSIPE
jgi:hypothetical protein